MRVRAQHAQMIQHAIAVLFGITAITPIKAAWVVITVANVVMMWILSFGYRQGMAYFFFSGLFCLIQGSPLWTLGHEIWWVAATVLWMLALLPRDKHGRIFALSIGLVVTCVLIYACPPPWAGYDRAMYETRLYSTAAFLGVAFGSALMTRNPSTMLAVPWFLAVLIAGSQRGFDRWMVGIYTNLIWSCCLICWLAISRRKDEFSADEGYRIPGVPQD